MLTPWKDLYCKLDILLSNKTQELPALKLLKYYFLLVRLYINFVTYMSLLYAYTVFALGSAVIAETVVLYSALYENYGDTVIYISGYW